MSESHPTRGDVALVRESVMAHAWTAIHGGTCTGKTQLAAQVARFTGHSPIWVRLRELELARQAARRIDLALEVLSGVPNRSGQRALPRCPGQVGPRFFDRS